MTDTGPLPVLSLDSQEQGAPKRGRELSVDDLFASMNTAALPVLGAVGAAAEATVLIVDDDVLDDGDEVPDLGLGLTRSRVEVAIEDLRRSERLRLVEPAAAPRIPLSLLWFALGVASLFVGRYAAVAVFAPVAMVAAVQAGAALEKAGGRARPVLAGSCALAVVLAASAPTSRAVGFAVLAGVAASLIGALHTGGFDPATASDTVRSWLGVALAGAVPVVFARVEPALAVLLFVLVCGYDAGHHLVGSSATSWYEGPLAGSVGVLAVGFAAVVVQPGALADHPLWPAIVVATVACPLGPLVASLTLPRAGAFAPALRRLDSLIVLAPLWVLLFA